MAFPSTLDALSADAAVGASIGLFAGGLLGLPMRPMLRASVAGCLGFAAALVAVAVWVVVHLGAMVRCSGSLCFPEWTYDRTCSS
jgi:hypothetical protein